MLLLLASAALAADLHIVGFSPTGHLFTWAEVEGTGVRLYTVDVTSGTWNHYPVQDSGLDAAITRVPAGYAVPIAEAVAGRPMSMLREGSRDHAHETPHITSWSMRMGTRLTVATLTERPSCPGGVEPWLTWVAGNAPVELLADRNPPRWPACALSYEIASVLSGPRGAVVLVLRAWELQGDQLVERWAVASTRVPSGP